MCFAFLPRFSYKSPCYHPSSVFCTPLPAKEAMLHLQGPLNQVYSEEGFAIYIGSAANAANTTALNDAGVRYILNVSERVRFRRVSATPVVAYQVPLSDFGDTPLSSVLDECFSVINEARGKGNILVHCQGGVNRSPTVVIAYLMHALQWDLKRAWEHVKERRSIASPHERYMQQLIEIEKDLFGTTTVDFNEYQSTSLQASLRRIRQQQFQSTLLPFQDCQTSPSKTGSPSLASPSPCPSSSIYSNTSSSSNITNNHHNVGNSPEVTTEESFSHFPHHLPQLNLECIS